LPDGSVAPIAVIRSIGEQLHFYYSDDPECNLSCFDRQIRAFGPDIQALLMRLHVGVVGAGGTGSSTAEQLARLGIGKISIFDGDRLGRTNVSRVYGSGIEDAGMQKVELIKRLADRIGLGTTVDAHFGMITSEATAKDLRNCDIIFGCTDDEWGRSILNKTSVGYMIPLFDMGVRIDSDGARIRSVQGRVTTVTPGSACLLCRERITTDAISAEVMAACNPTGAVELRREGYLANLPTSAPAVIAFTTATAASAVGELLHRLTGFMGAERSCTETILFFDQCCVRTNGGVSTRNCFCQQDSEIGIGDQVPFLGSVWLS
jgi:molybdopterin/thiamine biosynthesis adenylyltransferase